MKIEKEIRKKSLLVMRPSIKQSATRLAFKENLSFSRFVENALIKEIERAKRANKTAQA